MYTSLLFLFGYIDGFKTRSTALFNQDWETASYQVGGATFDVAIAGISSYTSKILGNTNLTNRSISSGANNAASFAKYKQALKTAEEANPVIFSLQTTGKLPSNYITKSVAISNGWKPGKALNNFVPGAQIGGDIYLNKTQILPNSYGRIWYEADVGLTNTMSRAKQPGKRLIYSNDGIMYVTSDHYNTFQYIGKYK